MLKQAKALTLSLLMVLSAFLLVACGKPTISDASITMQTTHYVYTGVAITPDLVITWQNKVLVEQTDYVLTYHNNTNAGIASILVEGKNKFQGNKTMYFTIAPATITGISAESLNLAFEEGKHHQIEVIGLQPNDVVLYRTSTIADWTTENPQFSSFGNFVVYYQVQRANHAPFYGSATVAITPLDLTSVTAANQKVVFDGQEKSIALQGLLPTDTVRYKTSALDEWSEQNPTFQNVGNYTIYYQVQRSGFLTLESSATIIIEPKEQTIMVDDVTSVFDFQSKQIVVPADDAQIFYKLNEEDDWTQINPTFIDVGDYTVYYKVQKNNHIDLIGSAHIIITPASISVPNFSRSVTHDGSAQSLILPQLPEGAEIVFKTLVDGEWQTTLPTFTEIGEHKVYYLVTKTNHFPYSDIATLTITSRTQENVVANDVLVTYDGNDYSIHVTGAPEGSTITYSLQENGVYTQENFMVTNAGIVQVYFKIEHPFYATFMGSATVVIEKATLTLVTPPTASDITVGQPLTASTLTDGLVVHNEQEVSGIFAWKDENANNIFPTLTESGFYETLVIFEHENAQNFFPLILPMRVRVNKIAIEVHAFVRDPIAAGMSLYDIALDYDVFVQNEMIALDGTISFLPNQALIAGTNLYDWMFIPNDPNYSEYSGLISLTFPDNLTLLGVEIDAAQPTQTFYAFDLLSPSNLTVNGVYYDASTQSEIRMPVHGWTADYGEYDFLTPLHTSIAIRYASFETTFDLTVNKKFYSPYYHYLEYIGPQTVTPDFVLLNEYFSIEDFDGTFVITSVEINTKGMSFAYLQFSPKFAEFYFGEFTRMVPFRVFEPLLIREIYFNQTLIASDPSFLDYHLEVTGPQNEIKVVFDDTQYVVTLLGLQQDIRLQSNITYSIDLKSGNQISLSVSRIQNLQEELECHQFYFWQNEYISQVQFSLFTGSGLMNADAWREDRTVSEYYIHVYDRFLSQIIVELLDDTLISRITFNGMPFELEDLMVGRNDLMIEVYQNNVLVHSKPLQVEIAFQLQSQVEVHIGEDVLYGDMISVSEQVQLTVHGTLIPNAFSLAYYESDHVLTLYTLDKSSVITNPTLQVGTNNFMVRLTHTIGSETASVWFYLSIVKQNTYLQDYIDSIYATLYDHDYYFEYYGNYYNLESIHKYYTLQEVYENLIIETTQFFQDNHLTLLMQIVGDSIQVQVWNEDLQIIELFQIIVNYYGEVSSDTTLHLYGLKQNQTIESEDLQSLDQEIHMQVGDYLYVTTKDDYQEFQLSSQDIAIFYESIFFMVEGEFEVTFHVIASDRTEKTFVVRFVVTPAPSLLTIEFANQEQLQLRADLEEMQFGDFVLRNYSESETSILLQLLKVYSLSDLQAFSNDGPLLVNLISENTQIYNNRILITSFQNVMLHLMQEDDFHYALLEYQFSLQNKIVVLELKIVFVDVTPSLFLTVTKDNIATTKEIGLFENMLIGNIHSVSITGSTYWVIDFTDCADLLSYEGALEFELQIECKNLFFFDSGLFEIDIDAPLSMQVVFTPIGQAGMMMISQLSAQELYEILQYQDPSRYELSIIAPTLIILV